MIRMQRFTNLVGVMLIGILSLSSLVLPANADVQSYNVLNAQAQAGMLMSLTTNSGVVEPTTIQNSALLQGVFSPGSTNLQAQPGQVNVASDGTVSTLVSTLNGNVGVGDQIGASALTGIGSKAAASGWIIGVAQASLDAKTSGAVATTVSDNHGGKHTVYVAAIPVVVHVAYYTKPSSATKTSTGILASIESLASSVAGKHASLLSIVLSFLILLVGIGFAGLTVASAVHGAFGAIGRQPLSKKVVFRIMVQTFGIAALIVVGVVLGALLILRIL